MELGQGDVDGGRKRCERSDETELALVAGQPQRDREPEVVGPGVDGGEVALQLGHEIVEAGIGAAQRLVTQVLEMCRPHSARFSTRRPMPSGCTASRSTFTGGSSRSGDDPSVSTGRRIDADAHDPLEARRNGAETDAMKVVMTR
jgi:hypothetical protein